MGRLQASASASRRSSNSTPRPKATSRCYNCEEQAGAIGRIPSFLAHRVSVALIKFDVETGEPVRDADGFCIRCAPNEVGEAIGQICERRVESRRPVRGLYRRRRPPTERSCATCSRTETAWFRTGDLMRNDETGYFYFVDRIGDTFRWKGENVVDHARSPRRSPRFPASSKPTSMAWRSRAPKAAPAWRRWSPRPASISPRLRRHLADACPPMRVRCSCVMRREIEMTATFKQKKPELSREGYDPTTTTDDIYFDDPERRAFVRVDAALFDRINGGAFRL